MILSDIASFNDTIQNFIRVSLSRLEKMNANQYVAALYDFLNDDRADKWIANPRQGSGYYFGMDTVEMRHIPREALPLVMGGHLPLFPAKLFLRSGEQFLCHQRLMAVGNDDPVL